MHLIGFQVLCAPVVFAMNLHEIESGDIPRSSDLGRVIQQLDTVGDSGQSAWMTALLVAESLAFESLQAVNSRYADTSSADGKSDGEPVRLQEPDWDIVHTSAYIRTCRCAYQVAAKHSLLCGCQQML